MLPHDPVNFDTPCQCYPSIIVLSTLSMPVSSACGRTSYASTRFLDTKLSVECLDQKLAWLISR